MNEDKIWLALEEVIDPEIGINIVDLGLVYDIEIQDDRAKIEMTLTIPECPLADEITANVEEAAQKVEGISEVEVKLVWEPKWTPARMSEEALEEIRARQMAHP
ncbi:metal-sulfur cluster assembly factor [Paenibacillus senegalensis]|uniref:metal-sulfur cluster assembly factor n=1 Tax=Paenibacillus senegalensis TaxID=1465766 RepID=UPI00028851D0|nr:iron-sulfur cluster assembly protein [Paenibacillus senegalensis]